jgi:hypothetical protein
MGQVSPASGRIREVRTCPGWGPDMSRKCLWNLV